MTVRLLLSIAPFFVSGTNARDITFPPVSGYSSQQVIPQGRYDPDITQAKFAGLMTYANLPYVHCLAPEGQDVEPFDIAILGAPFDTVDSAWNIYTGENLLLDWAKIVDCGDAPLTFLDNTIALKQLGKAHQIISSREANSSEHSTPKIVTLGGDHTTTLPALRSAYHHWGTMSVIHFDSHIDTWDPEVLDGGISHYAGVNHGTFLHIAHEEGLIRNTSIHAGIRAPVSRPKGDLRNDVRCGFEMVKAREIDRLGVSGVIEKLKSRVGGSKVYISVDIDVLDPAFAPATGTAEVGGWSTRELLSILDGLEGLDVVGADVVEVAPVYDSPGEPTILAASEVVQSLIGLMVKAPA